MRQIVSLKKRCYVARIAFVDKADEEREGKLVPSFADSEETTKDERGEVRHIGSGLSRVRAERIEEVGEYEGDELVWQAGE